MNNGKCYRDKISLASIMEKRLLHVLNTFKEKHFYR